MREYNIVVILGSLREHSINGLLANALKQFAPADFKFQYLALNDLPLYSQDDDSTPCSAVISFKAAITAADGLIFVTPEYNRSIPGVLKNALDHASRPYGQSAWKGKPGGILGASIGINGTAMAQQHLRNILSYLEVHTLSQPEAYVQIKDEANATVTSVAENSKSLLQRWITSYVDWVKIHSPA